MYFIMYITLDIKFYSTYTKQKNKRNPLDTSKSELQNTKDKEKILKAARKDRSPTKEQQTVRTTESIQQQRSPETEQCKQGGENKCLLLTQTPVCTATGQERWRYTCSQVPDSREIYHQQTCSKETSKEYTSKKISKS